MTDGEARAPWTDGGTYKIGTNRYLQNQWQVGNFVAQKQLKSKGRPASSLYLETAASRVTCM
jgi:hypothetical protein